MIDITPKDSICPVYISEPDQAQIAADQIEYEKNQTLRAGLEKKKIQVLKKLGLTADELAILLS